MTYNPFTSKALLLWLLWFIHTPHPLYQILAPIMGGSFPAASFPAITLGVHNKASCSATTSCGVAVGTTTTGSAIYCTTMTPLAAAAVVVTLTDNVNTGVNYQPAAIRLRDSGHSFHLGSWYIENVTGGATTATISGYASGSAQIACTEIKGVPTSYVFDSNVVASKAVLGANPTAGTTITPTNNNDIVFGGLWRAATPTAGTNFTLLDGITDLWPEYWIQTTATGTAAPYTATSGDNAVIMAGFGQNHSGSCDSTMIFDWTGGTNTNTVAATTLQSSTKGGAAQPNGDVVASTNDPGWTITGLGTGLTYATAAYQPLATTRTCPFYTGSGTGTLGLNYALSNGASHGASYWFVTSQANVSACACITTPATIAAGTADILTIGGGDWQGNPDYDLLQLNSNGATTTFALEHDSVGTTISSTTHWTAATQYWIQWVYKQAGLHTIKIYQGCAANPTLQETLTADASVTGGGPADRLTFLSGADSYAGGNVTIGAVALDILHGSALLP